MMLVPKIRKMVEESVAGDFWGNHQKHQDDLDRQNEGSRSAMSILMNAYEVITGDYSTRDDQ